MAGRSRCWYVTRSGSWGPLLLAVLACQLVAIGLGNVVGSVQNVKQVELVGLTVETASRAPLLLLREHDEPRRVLPIFVGPVEAKAIALAAADESPPRPLTHDLMVTLVETAHASIDRVQVTELRDDTFFAELAVSGPAGERRVDSRASDAIAVAVRADAPLFVAGAVLDEAGVVLAEAIDEETIDEAVARFRSALETFDPAQLQADAGGEPRADTPRQDEGGEPDAPRNDAGDPDDPAPGSAPEERPDSPDA